MPKDVADICIAINEHSSNKKQRDFTNFGIAIGDNDEHFPNQFLSRDIPGSGTVSDNGVCQQNK